MNMQVFYRQLTTKPSQTHRRALVQLTRASRTQILKATEEGAWLWWNEPETEPTNV